MAGYRDEKLSDLPSLEDVILNTRDALRAGGLQALTNAEMWGGDTRHDLTNNAVEVWLRVINRGEPTAIRMMNVATQNIMPGVQGRAYEAQVKAVAQGMHENESITLLPTNANITPRLVSTEVHHDTWPHISTTMGFHRNDDQPVKLWLLWPSTEMNHLCGYYGNTNAAIGSADHGAFLVQMSGESIITRANPPNAVLSLNSCYIYSNQYKGDIVIDPTTVRAGRYLVSQSTSTFVSQPCRVAWPITSGAKRTSTNSWRPGLATVPMSAATVIGGRL